MQKLLLYLFKHRFALCVTIVYAVVVSIQSCFHEVWRDEVIKITMVTDSSSIGELIQLLRYYGHPPLFQLILYFGYKIFPHYIVLKILNIVICVIAVYIFLLKAPFSKLQKILLICGVLPLYIYPVINCNYGISMLLIFIVGVLYKERFRNIVPFSIALVLLSFAHAHSTVIAIGIVFSMIIEAIFMRKKVAVQRPNSKKLIQAIVIFIVGISWLILYSIPDSNTTISALYSLSISKIIKAFVDSAIYPGKAFHSIFGVDNALFSNVIIWGLFIYFIRKLNLLSIFAFTVIALSMFYHLVYEGDQLRHQGALYLLIVFLFWSDTDSPKEPKKLIHNIGKTLFTLILLIHVGMAYPLVKNDILYPYSSSKKLAQFLNNSPAYKNAIIMNEPGNMLEALSFYTDHRKYFYRDGRFGNQQRFTTDIPLAASMKNLLRSARQLKKDYDEEIIILIGERVRLNVNGPYNIKTFYGRSFQYSKTSLREFFNATEKIASFHGALTDENCDVYVLK